MPSGGGIGGLALALALHRVDPESTIEVDIYEAASELTQVGAGLTLWPRTWEMFEKLGLSNSVKRLIPNDDKYSRVAFTLRKSDQPVGLELGYLSSKGRCQSFF